VEGGIFFSLFFYKIDFKSNRPFFLDFVFQPVELGEPFYLKLTFSLFGCQSDHKLLEQAVKCRATYIVRPFVLSFYNDGSGIPVS
jgi:hypothetical protein